MNNQLTYRVNLPSPSGYTSWTGGLARNELSHFLLCNKHHACHALFNKNNDGTHNQGLPLVRFSGGRKGFTVTIFKGLESSTVNDIRLALALFAVDRGGEFDGGRNLAMSVQPGKAAYNGLFVIGRTDKARKNSQGTVRHVGREFNDGLRDDPEKAKAEFKRLLAMGIFRQIAYYREIGIETDLVTPVAKYLYLKQEPTTEKLGKLIDAIKVDKLELVSPVKFGKNWLIRVAVEFTLPFELTGYWSAGRGMHLGHGHIFKNRVLGK